MTDVLLEEQEEEEPEAGPSRIVEPAALGWKVEKPVIKKRKSVPELNETTEETGELSQVSSIKTMTTVDKRIAGDSIDGGKGTRCPTNPRSSASIRRTRTGNAKAVDEQRSSTQDIGGGEDGRR